MFGGGNYDLCIGDKDDMKRGYISPIHKNYELPSGASSNTFLSGKARSEWLLNMYAEVEVFGV